MLECISWLRVSSCEAKKQQRRLIDESTSFASSQFIAWSHWNSWKSSSLDMMRSAEIDNREVFCQKLYREIVYRFSFVSFLISNIESSASLLFNLLSSWWYSCVIDVKCSYSSWCEYWSENDIMRNSFSREHTLRY